MFTWLDGGLILAYLLLGGALIGSLLLIGTASASRLLRTPQLSWQRFSVALAPMAAASVILVLTMLTVTHLKAEHFWLGWLPYFRATLLGLGWLGSVSLAWLLITRATCGWGRKLMAGVVMLWPPSLICSIWYLVFFVW